MDPIFELALCIKAAQRELERVTNDALRPLGVTGVQGDALVVIGQVGPISLKDLGELLIAEAGHPSRLVDRLVDAGLVDRLGADDDRRRIELTLTAKGRRLATRVEAARAEVLDVGRALVGDRPLDDVLTLFRELLAGTAYGDLVARRRRLDDDQGAH